MLKVVVIDDDDASCDLINEIITIYCPYFKTVAVSNSLSDGIKAIQNYDPDLVILDMELPDGKGYDIFNLVSNIRFEVLFISAYKEYAVKVVRYKPLNYLLKPIDIREFLNTIQVMLVNSENLKHSLPVFKGKTDGADIIVVKTLNKIHILHKEEIMRCEAAKNYTTIFKIKGSQLLASHTLKYFNLLLPYPQFIRVHQSHLINTNYIDYIDNANACIILSDKTKVPFSSRKHPQLMHYLNEFSK